MLNDRSSILAFLETRRSARPRDLIAPGPDAGEMQRMLTIAMRTPDHGKLAPWRFVHVPAAKRMEFAAMLEAAYRAANPDPGRLEIEAVQRFAHQAPELIVVLSAPVPEHKIPVWEQNLSCGAACMNLLLAAHALGYAAGWVTGWAAYSDVVLSAFGGKADERIAGFIFIGSAGAEPEERIRPEYAQIVSEWGKGGQ